MNPSTGAGAFQQHPLWLRNDPHAQTAKTISLTSKAVPSPEQVSAAQQDVLFPCYVVESGYSTHLPHPERMRPKTRLPSPRSEQPQRKRAVKKQDA